MHAYDPLTPLDETLRFLDDAVRAGKIHYAGLSNFTGWQTQRAVDVAERLGLAPLVSLQPQYNLLVREIEWEIVPAAARQRARPAALVAARRGLAHRQVRARGAAHRRHPARREPGARRRGLRPPERRRAHVGRRRRRPRARRRARGHAWPRSRWPGSWTAPGVTSVILGARTVEQLDDNLGAVGLHLTGDEIGDARRRQRPGRAATTRTAGPGEDQRSRTI